MTVAKHISLVIQWVQANLVRTKASRCMFIWAHSAGATVRSARTSAASKLYGPKGVGVKGAIFMSGQFNILPVQPAGAGGGRRAVDKAAVVLQQRSLAPAVPCGVDGAGSSQGAISGPRGVTPGGQRGGPWRGWRADRRAPRAWRAVDPAVQLHGQRCRRSMETKVALLLATAESIRGSMAA